MPPVVKKTSSYKTVEEALVAGPASFLELMAALDSKDGREIVRSLDALYAAKQLGRDEDGRYVLKSDKH
jgi:2,5-furandicarboxylate decarboxylase 1